MGQCKLTGLSSFLEGESALEQVLTLTDDSGKDIAGEPIAVEGDAPTAPADCEAETTEGMAQIPDTPVTLGVRIRLPRPSSE